MRGKFQRKKGVVHPISIRIDRFGRIAFNKNKELSQASYENCENNKANAGGPKSSSSDREERKDASPAPFQANVQAVRFNNNDARSLELMRSFNSENARRFHSLRNNNRNQRNHHN